MIEDEDASMPDGWLENESTLVPDPTSERPSDWWVNTIAVPNPGNPENLERVLLFPVMEKLTEFEKNS